MTNTSKAGGILTDGNATPLSTVAVGSSTFVPVFSPGATQTVSSTGLVTAAAPTAYSTVILTKQSQVAVNGGVSTTTFLTSSVVTDLAVYNSLASAAAESSRATKTQTSASSNASSGSTNSKSSSNLSTIIPAVVVPVAVILIATLAAFWFFMRRRHRRDLKNQPAFVMAAKTEKLTSTTNSLASDHKDPPSLEKQLAPTAFSYSTKKPLPPVRTRDMSPTSSSSSPASPPEYSRGAVGAAKTSNIRDEQRRSPLLPPTRTDSSSPNARHIASFATTSSPASNYSPQTIRSANPHLLAGPQTPHNSIAPSPRNMPGRGPPVGVGTSNHVLTRNRSQSLTNPRAAGGQFSNLDLYNSYRDGPTSQRPPTAPTSGFRGSPPRSFSPAAHQQQQRSFSPSGNRAPPPPPIKAPAATNSTGAFINQPQYSPIIKDLPKAKRPSVVVPPSQNRGISYNSHTSTLLPSPQSDARKDHNLTTENLRIARLANSSRLVFGNPTADNVSEISAADEEVDAKSDVSSLDELEKFNFERDARDSRSGSALGDLPGTRSGSAMNNNSPIVGQGHERPWN